MFDEVRDAGHPSLFSFRDIPCDSVVQLPDSRSNTFGLLPTIPLCHTCPYDDRYHAACFDC